MRESLHFGLLKLRLLLAAQLMRPAREWLVRQGLAPASLLTDPDQLTTEEIILGFDDVDDYLS